MEKNDEIGELTPERRASILDRDWRPWAYAILGLRSPATWGITVYSDRMVSMVPEEICESYSWKMHQQYLVAVLKREQTVDGDALWIVKPVTEGARRGVSVRPSRAWPEDTWDHDTLRRWLPDFCAGEQWHDVAESSWEVSRDEAGALATLIDLLSFHLSEPEQTKERGLHLVK